MMSLAFSVEPPWWSTRGMTGIYLAVLALALAIVALAAASRARRSPLARRTAWGAGASFAAVVLLFLVLRSIPLPHYEYGLMATRVEPTGESGTALEDGLREDAPSLAHLLDQAVEEGRAHLVDGEEWRHRERLDAVAGSAGASEWVVPWRGFEVQVREGWFIVGHA